MNIVFMGTPDFAVESLKKIYEAGDNVLAVVSQPDKPSGRGMKLMPTPTKEFALEKDIKVYQPEKVKNNEEFINELESLNPDVMVVVAYGKILPEKVLQIPRYGCINVHGSLLPKYRGAAPIQWAIINGESETGVTTMYMDKGMDTGDMILKESILIEDNDTYGSLYEKLKVLGGELIVTTLSELEKGNVNREKQSEDFTMAPMIFKEDCKIDWSKTAFEIKNLVRGVNPAPGAWTTLGDKVYKIWECEEVEETIFSEKTGTVLVANSKDGLVISTGKNAVKVNVIQAPNSKRMNILDYLRGNSIEVGSVMQ